MPTAMKATTTISSTRVKPRSHGPVASGFGQSRVTFPLAVNWTTLDPEQPLMVTVTGLTSPQA